MIKDIVIAILAGIVISRQIIPPGDPARAAVILVIAVIVFMVLLELDDLWDKRLQVIQIIRSRMRWYKIRLRTYPAELAQRRRRRKMMQEYIQRLREMPQEERGQNPEESEA